jgi:hypothetical protein
MKPLKWPFQLQWAKKQTVMPDGAQHRSSSGSAGNKNQNYDSKHLSIYPEGDFRTYSEENMVELRGNMMLEQLHNEQRCRLWYTQGSGQGVVLKRGKGEYVACPPQLEKESGGLFDQFVKMNIRVCSLQIS